MRDHGHDCNQVAHTADCNVTFADVGAYVAAGKNKFNYVNNEKNANSRNGNANYGRDIDDDSNNECYVWYSISARINLTTQTIARKEVRDS